MSRVNGARTLFAAFALPVVASGALLHPQTNYECENSPEGIALIQLETRKLHSKKMVEEVDANKSDSFHGEEAPLKTDARPHKALDAMTAQMRALQSHLVEVEKQNLMSLEHQQADYSHKLEDQAASNARTKNSNRKLASEIEGLRVSNKKLRINAEHVMDKNAKLKKELEELKRNFSIAAEFAEQTLLSSNDYAILDELKQKDEEKSQKIALERDLNAIGHDSAVMMLKLSSHSTRPAVDELNPNTLLQPLVTSFEQLASEQNASEVALQESFQTAFRKGEEQGDQMSKDQEELKATRDRETSLHERLAAATAHLEKVHQQLSSHISHLRLFAKHLGDQPRDEAQTTMAARKTLAKKASATSKKAS